MLLLHLGRLCLCFKEALPGSAILKCIFKDFGVSFSLKALGSLSWKDLCEGS